MDAMRISRLTERQRSCLRLVHAHMSSKEIASQLGIGPGTVDQHIKAAKLLLGVTDRREAAQLLVNHESGEPNETPPETGAGNGSPADNWMGETLASVRHGLCNVLNFSGRDTREQYWPYAMFLLIVAAAIAFFIIEPPLMMAAMEIKQRAGEQGMDLRQYRSDYLDLLPAVSHLPPLLGLLTLVNFLLIAAAIARRRHDWSLLELWGFLPLSIASIMVWMRPTIVLQIPTALAIFALLYALIRGGAPERIAAGIVVAALLLTVATTLTASRLPNDLDGSLLALDFAMFLLTLLLALRANRIWPIWAAAISALGVALHLITVMNPMVVPAAYGAISAVGTYPILLLLIVGTRNHRRRLKQYGVNPAWTPLRKRSSVKL